MTPVPCEVCGRPLRDRASAARRLGPVCARKMRPTTEAAAPLRPAAADGQALELAGQLPLPAPPQEDQ